MERVLNWVTRIAMIIATAIFGAVLLSVVVNIVGRRLFQIPFTPTMEIVQYGMLTAVCLAATRTTLLKRHIAVTVLLDQFSPRGKAAILAVEWLICAIVFGGLSYGYIAKISTAAAMAKVTDLLLIPYQYIFLVMAVLFFLTGCIFFLLMLESIRDFIRGGTSVPQDDQSGDGMAGPSSAQSV